MTFAAPALLAGRARRADSGRAAPDPPPVRPGWFPSARFVSSGSVSRELAGGSISRTCHSGRTGRRPAVARPGLARPALWSVWHHSGPWPADVGHRDRAGQLREHGPDRRRGSPVRDRSSGVEEVLVRSAQLDDVAALLPTGGPPGSSSAGFSAPTRPYGNALDQCRPTMSVPTWPRDSASQRALLAQPKLPARKSMS